MTSIIIALVTKIKFLTENYDFNTNEFSRQNVTRLKILFSADRERQHLTKKYKKDTRKHKWNTSKQLRNVKTITKYQKVFPKNKNLSVSRTATVQLAIKNKFFMMPFHESFIVSMFLQNTYFPNKVVNCMCHDLLKTLTCIVSFIENNKNRTTI